ncbi:MAG: hypothetical protein DRH08_04240 [Deltaproteobacteria bacterium]|nr:MAG: hypothetical protein DRH08_04240 [Deltaproteobacteria bacterium]
MATTSTPQINYSTNIKYDKNIFNWLFVRDAIEGEAAIKFKNELYLPMPSGMIDFPTATASQTQYYSQIWGDDFIKRLMYDKNPNFHRNPAYAAYLTRAQFPELCSYVLRGLVGLAMKQLPQISLPKSMEYLLEDATTTGLSLNEYYNYLLEEVLSTGRIASVFDVAKDPDTGSDTILFSSYTAETIPNWRESCEKGENGRLQSIRLLEVSQDNFDSSSNESYSGGLSDVKSVIELDSSNGVYVVLKYDKHSSIDVNGEDDNFVIPSYKGRTLNYIPAIIIGSLNNNSTIDPSPMLPIASTSQHIYMKSADLSQSEFMSCSPMLVLTGVDPESAPKSIGSTVSLAIPNPDAKVYFTSTDTSALSHVEGHMDNLYTKAINMGAQLLDTSPKPAETAETTRLKQSASSATLLTSIRSISHALNKQLRQIAVWMGEDPEEIEFIPNTEFIAPMITAAEIRELVQSWLNGALSLETVLENFKKAGIVNEASTVEDEKAKIKEEEKEVMEGSVKATRMASQVDSSRGELKEQKQDEQPNTGQPAKSNPKPDQKSESNQT